MLDEPLGSLDRGLRERLVVELSEVLGLLEIPALYVTHDQFEAFAIADRLAIMRAGLIVRDGAPAEVYAEPRTEFVARFLGLENVVGGRVKGDGMVETLAGHFGPVDHAGETATLLLRTEGASLCGGSGPNVLSGVVEARLFQGAAQRLVVASGGQAFGFGFDGSIALPAAGEPVHLRVGKVQVLEPDA